MISRASLERAPRPAGARPVAVQAGAASAPTPKAASRRPSLRKSIVAHSAASTSGSRSGSTTTFMPNLRRSVAPASAAMRLIASSWGSGAAAVATRRSDCQMESTSRSSQSSIQRQKARAEENGNAATPRPMRTLTGPPSLGLVRRASSGGRSAAYPTLRDLAWRPMGCERAARPRGSAAGRAGGLRSRARRPRWQRARRRRPRWSRAWRRAGCGWRRRSRRSAG